MIWQDYVISAAQIGFFIALIPSIKSEDKPAKVTSFMNVVLLSTVGFCELTLSLYFSAITITLSALAWAVLGVQKTKNK